MGLADKLRAEKEKLEKESESRGGGEFTKVNWFTPEKGNNFVRFVKNPVDDESGDPILWVERTMHFGIPIKKKDGGIAKISGRCPRDLGHSCPMCDKYEELITSGDKEAANDFKPTVRYFYNVIDYKKKEAGVLTGGQMIHKDVVESIDLGVNFWDTEKGLDFRLIKEVEPGKPARFGTKYSVKPAKIEITAIPEKLRPELENVIDLNTLYNEDMSDKMVEAFGGKVTKASTSTVSTAKKAVEESYKKEVVTGSVVTSDAMSKDADLEAELKALGL